MYTYEQRMKAVELYIKYEHRATVVSRELGYPNPNFIVRWYKEYLKNGNLKHSYQRGQKYSREQKQYALQYYE
jgi:putative transposase